MDHIEDNDADSTAVRADAEIHVRDDSFLKSFRFGVRATDKGALTRQTGWNWGLLSKQFWESRRSSDHLSRQPDRWSERPETQFSYDNFFRGDVSVPRRGWFPTDSLVAMARRRPTTT